MPTALPSWFAARGPVVAVLTCLCIPMHAGAATVGSPDHPADLKRDIAAACSQGATSIAITPGVYQLKDTLVFDHLSGVELDFSQAELVQGSGKDGVAFNHCAKVVFRGATLHYDHPRFCQARILAFGTDADKGGYYDVQIDPGYPQHAVFKSCVIFTAAERRIKFHTWDSDAKSVMPLDEAGKVRVFWGKENLLPPHCPVAVGDYLVCRGDGSSLLHADACSDCSFQDLTLYWGGIFGIFETGPSEGNHYLRIRLTPGPAPAGGAKPFISQSADGLHSAGARLGPDIEDCDFESMLDDAFAIHGYFQEILAVDGATLTVKESSWHIGDTARVSSLKGYSAEAAVTADVRQGDGKHLITLSQALAAHPGDKVGNPSASGSGYKIIHNTIRNNRARGILVKGDHGLIERNTIDGSTMSGISIGPEYFWNEGDYCHQVVVRGNVISNTNYATNDFGRNGAILIHGDGAKGNRTLTIEGNTITGVLGPNLVIHWADGVAVAGNAFIAPHQQAVGSDAVAGTLVWLEHCSNVAFTGNTVEKPGPADGALVVTGADVDTVTGQDSGLTRK